MSKYVKIELVEALVNQLITSSIKVLTEIGEQSNTTKQSQFAASIATDTLEALLTLLKEIPTIELEDSRLLELYIINAD